MLVHVIDDDNAVARTVARSAACAGWETSIHASADVFLARIDELQLGCIVSDVRMPGTSGTELIRILHAKCPEWPVIMMTGHADVGAAVTSFRHGALHFLQKPFKRAQLVEALNEAAQVAQRRAAERDRRQQVAVLDKLTKRETEILGALSKGLQSKVIAWEFGISTRTVEMHRSNILCKLGARNTTQAVALLTTATGA